MKDIVVLHFLADAIGIRSLDHEGAIFRQQIAYPGDEILQLARMPEHIARDDEVGRATFGADACRDFAAEERPHRGQPACVGLIGEIGRIDAQNVEARVAIVLKEESIVARDLDQAHGAGAGFEKAFAQAGRQPLGMVLRAGRGGRHPQVIGEQRVAVHFLADLQQTAFAAQDQAQRMMVGVIVVFSAHDEGVRQRHTAEIEDFLIVRAAARAAVERRAV